MIKHLFSPASLRNRVPAGVAIACMPNVITWQELPATERALVSNAVEKRRQQFATGRFLARDLLREIGSGVEAIGQHLDRTPIWPDGIVGSISHCDDLCAAAVAKIDNGVRSIGVDVEPAQPVAEEIWLEIANREELERWEFCQDDVALRIRRLFSAKEAAYKCVYPSCQQFIGFHDVEIDFEVAGINFRVRSKSHDERLRAALEAIEGVQFQQDGIIFSIAILGHRLD